MGGNPLHKRYIGHLLQYNPEVNFLTLDWLLRVAANDIVKWLEGWTITQGIGPHPIEPKGLCLVAEKAYIGFSGRQSVKLYCSAIDVGFRTDPHSHRFHTTQIDANFVDSGKTWNMLAAEQIVAETLDLLHHTFTAAYVGPDKPFWYRVSGSWVCGRALYQCPGWIG